MILLSGFLLSLLITIVLIPMANWLAIRIHALDIPSERKVHDRPIPRSGGIAMAMGVIFTVGFLIPKDPALVSYLVGSAIIVSFGLIDDFKEIGYKGKFAAQIAAALIVILLGGIKISTLGSFLPEGWLLPGYVSIPITVLVIVGITNAINLSDGLDGLAGGIALLGFCCIGYLAYLEGQTSIMVIAVCLVGAIFGFLRFNTFPASIFMGDSGSQFLGFSAVVLSLMLTQEDTPLSPFLPLVILGFPILDTVFVMAQRVAEKRPIFSADKNHLHHRLLRLGLYHTEAVIAIYFIQAFLVVAAIILKYHSEWLLFIGYIVFSSVLALVFFVADRTQWKLKRAGFFDTVIKGRLKTLRGHRYAIRISFQTLQYGLPLLLIVTSFIPAVVPVYLSVASGIAIVAVAVSWFLKKQIMPYVLMGALYLFTPFLVFFSTSEPSPWMHTAYERIYNLAFLALTFIMIATLKFTHRKQGFTIKPTDFLILFVVIAVPILLGDYFTRNKFISYTAVKTVVLFFGYEVLVGEVRGEYGKLTVLTIVALVVVMMRGIAG